jgi:membrane-associated phospholipid phosphatase
MFLANRILLVGTIVGVLAIPSSAQETSVPNSSSSISSLPDAPQPASNQDAVSLRNTPQHLLEDQKAIWTSPARLTLRDLRWIAPLAAATGVSIATDHHTMSSVVSHNANFNQSSVDASNGLTGGMVAIPAALYGIGLMKGNEHQRETGILGGEALVDSLVVQEGLKLIFWRERPSQDNARGLFFKGSAGLDSSFPSNHSVLAWSSAAVIASEYPSRWTQIGVYSMATGVSVTRVMGQQHFPTDVLIGSAAGWLIGRYVVRSHHRIRNR